MKAIETIYNNYRFRSRLEARWAIYFDTLGIQYEYEKEGYDLDEAGWYLPDFWLPQVKMWAEVKPEPFNESELAKARALVSGTEHELIMLVGLPEVKSYDYFEFYADENNKPVIFITDLIVDRRKFDKDYYHFYVQPCDSEIDDGCGIKEACKAAKMARFEHGERGIS